MSTAQAVILASALGLVVGFTLGQFYDLDLKTWKGQVPLVHLSKRQRRRKLPWNRVLGASLVIVMVFTFVQFQLFQRGQADCNAEQRRVARERGAASNQDSELLQRDSINLGVAIRAILGQPQPQNSAIKESVDDLNDYLRLEGIAGTAPQSARSEAALDWYQQEQLTTIETRLKNDAVRAANPYPNPRC